MRTFLVLAALGGAAALGMAALGASPFDAAWDPASGAGSGQLPTWALFTFAVSAFSGAPVQGLHGGRGGRPLGPRGPVPGGRAASQLVRQEEA